MTDLLILASHPVQYRAPLLAEIVRCGLDIQVGYYYQGGAGKSQFDHQFGLEIEWDIDLLSGYEHCFFQQQQANFSYGEQLRLLPHLLVWALRHPRTPLLIDGWFAEAVWLIWLLRILLRMPVLIWGETNPLSFEAAPKPAWRVALLRWLLRHSTATAYIGSRSRDFMLSMGVPLERLFPMPYSIDNQRFASAAKQQLAQRAAICQRYGLDPEMPTLLFCGKLIPKKHPIELLDAYLAAGLKDKAQLVFVGEGQLRRSLESRAREADASQVHLIGFFNQTEMPSAFVIGELLCLISEPTETWGLVVNEALACARPVILADTVGCAADLLREGENGWLVPLHDGEQLASTLRDAVEHYDDWAAMGQVGREIVKAHSFSIMAENLKDRVRSLQKQKGA